MCPFRACAWRRRRPQDWLEAPADLPSAAQRLEAAGVAADFKHCAIGTLRAGADQPAWIGQVPAALAGTQWLFCAADLLEAAPAAFDACADAVLAISRLGSDGFANLRCAAVSATPPSSASTTSHPDA